MPNKIRDLTGQTFGKLTAVSFAGRSNSRSAMWLCKCDCGNEKTVLGVSLTVGNTKSCGCITRPFKDLSGKVFGKLTVVSFAGSDKRGNAKWLCKCECGNEKTVLGVSLTVGNTKSCGCITRPFKDLSGKVFGKLTVVNFAGRDKRNILTWSCKCECGNEKVITGGSLTSGLTKSCGCLYGSENRQLRQKGIFSKITNKQGYAIMYCPEHPNSWKNGNLFEHTYVMSEHLGRPLKPNENVHHINGDRADNRIENLELWSKSQPCGQRVEDKLKHAIFLINEYKGEGMGQSTLDELKQAAAIINSRISNIEGK